MWAEYLALSGKWTAGKSRWSPGRFSEAIYNVLRERGYTVRQICRLFELHEINGSCSNDALRQVTVNFEIVDITPPAVTLAPHTDPPLELFAPFFTFQTFLPSGDEFESGSCLYDPAEKSCPIFVPTGGRLSIQVDEQPNGGGISFYEASGLCAEQSDCEVPAVVAPATVRFVYGYNADNDTFVPPT
jgi:hypothetical protein